MVGGVTTGKIEINIQKVKNHTYEKTITITIEALCHPLCFNKFKWLWPSTDRTGYCRISPFGAGRNYKPVGRWQYRGHRVLVTNGYYPNDPFGSYLNGIYGNHGSVCVYAKVVGN